MSDSLRPHESQHARHPCPSQTPGVYSNSCPSSRWCHPVSVVPFSSCPQSLPASGSFPRKTSFLLISFLQAMKVSKKYIHAHFKKTAKMIGGKKCHKLMQQIFHAQILWGKHGAGESEMVMKINKRSPLLCNGNHYWEITREIKNSQSLGFKRENKRNECQITL